MLYCDVHVYAFMLWSLADIYCHLLWGDLEHLRFPSMHVTWNWPNKSQILDCLLFTWTWACWCSCPEALCTAHANAPVLSSYCTSLRKVRTNYASTNSEFQVSIRRTVSQAPCPLWMTGPTGMHKSHVQEGGLATSFTGIAYFFIIILKGTLIPK
jgi:hypothetical protein